jgi:hypothetical protein
MRSNQAMPIRAFDKAQHFKPFGGAQDFQRAHDRNLRLGPEPAEGQLTAARRTFLRNVARRSKLVDRLGSGSRG